jgi:hypothetical protein
MAMKVVTPTTPAPVHFTKLSQRAAVMRAAHALARSWMAPEVLVGDYQDFLKAALRMAWDLARGRQPRVPTWAMAMAIPAEAKALVQEGPVTNHHRLEIAEGENPFAAFRAAFGVAARWGWPTAKVYASMAAEIAAAKVVATCHYQGEEHTFWSC